MLLGPPQQHLALCGPGVGVGVLIPLLTANEMFYVSKEMVLSVSVPTSFLIRRNFRNLGCA